MMDIFCLALVIYVEARGEAVDGQLMVADVVINRQALEGFPDDICGVVFDHKQFSGLNDKLELEAVFTDPAWEQSVVVATEALEGSSMGSEATHYHTLDSNPYWSNHLTLLGQYGNHLFYEEDGEIR